MSIDTSQRHAQVLNLKHRKKYTKKDGRDALVMVAHPAYVQILSIH